MKYVRRSIPNIKCLFIGGVSKDDREYYQRLQEIAQGDGLTDQVVFTGERRDIPDLINSLSILIHASVSPEPFGRVLLEGMALQKPVISTNIGAGREIVEDGKTGLLVTPGDPEKLSDAIVRLLKDPQMAAKMGKAGRARLDDHFHLKTNVKQTEKLYDRVLSSV